MTIDLSCRTLLHLAGASSLRAAAAAARERGGGRRGRADLRQSHADADLHAPSRAGR